MKTILIAGGTGLIGNALVEHLLALGYCIKLLTRKNPQQITNTNKLSFYNWDYQNRRIEEDAFSEIDAIINLSGANVGSKHWTKSRKIEILESRTQTTKLLIDQVIGLKLPIDVFINASATGFYGAVSSDKIFEETDVKGNDFLSNVCEEWEADIKRLEVANIRSVIIRTGVVFSKDGGMLKKVLPLAKLGLNSRLGSGKQYLPWIHIDDICNLYLHILENPELEGIFNAVSSEYITNKEFTEVLAKECRRQILMPPLPNRILKIIFGEMSAMLTEGSRISNKKIVDTGFKFKYNNLQSALQDLLK